MRIRLPWHRRVAARLLRAGDIILIDGTHKTVQSSHFDQQHLMGGEVGLKAALRIECDDGKVLFPVYPAIHFKRACYLTT